MISVREQRLEQALRDLAHIVALHGHQYMPMFESVGKELMGMKMRRDQLRQVMAGIEAPVIDLTTARNVGIG